MRRKAHLTLCKENDMTYLKITDVDLNGKKVMIREDLNVPLKDGEITSDMRIQASIPYNKTSTYAECRSDDYFAFGQADWTEFIDEAFSLGTGGQEIGRITGSGNTAGERLVGWSLKFSPGQVVLCENVRFNVGEKK